MENILDSHPKWNHSEFSAFLLLYGAFADMEMTKEEEAMIRSKVNDETYNKIKEEFDSTNDYQQVEIIMAYKGLYFPTVDRRNELLDMIKKEFLADGDYSLMEHNLMGLLQKLM